MNILVVELKRPYAFATPFNGAAFAALLLVVDPTITTEERASLAGQLVAQGCRNAVCVGLESSSWEDEIDWICVMNEVNEVPGNAFVMTTCHDDEPLEEVVEYFHDWARIDNKEPVHRVAILVGEDQARRAELQHRIEAQ